MNQITLLSLITLLFLWLSPQIGMAQDCPYRVIKVKENDILSIRSGPSIKYPQIGMIPSDGAGIQIIGLEIKIGKSRWVPIQYQGLEGWVNRGHLEEDCQLKSLAANKPQYHKVVYGDTLFSIAKIYGYNVEKLAEWNNLQPPYNLLVGQNLRVSPTTPDCTYHVIKVPENDMLWIRLEANAKSQRIGAIPYNGDGIKIIDKSETVVDKSHWVTIKYREIEGWVNRAFLEEDC